METRLWLLRCGALVGLAASVPAALLAIALFFASLAHPQIELERLYDLSMFVSWTAFGSIFFGLSLSLALNSISRPLRLVHDRLRADFGRYRPLLSICGSAIVILLAITLILGFTFVHHSGSVWTSTSRAGTQEIPDVVARIYMWRLARFSSLLLLLSAGSVGFESASIFKAARHRN